jgi:hypothetical protein
LDTIAIVVKQFWPDIRRKKSVGDPFVNHPMVQLITPICDLPHCRSHDLG